MDAIEALEIISKLSILAGLAFQAYNAAVDEMKRHRRVGPLETNVDEHRFTRTSAEQIESTEEEHLCKPTVMDATSFDCLLQLLRSKLRRYSHRKPVSPEMRLSLTLSYLEQGSDFNELCRTHKLGLSTVRQIIYETCHAIWEELHGEYLAPPNVSNFIAISEAFYVKTGMPNCLGAIDGKHINISRPKKNSSLYFNYKQTFSITLLAACDSNYCFSFVEVGPVASQSGSGVTGPSDFGRKLLSGTLDVPPNRLLPDGSQNFLHYFAAGSAFPLKDNIMRPFPGRNLPADKAQFNQRLSNANQYIENTFAILANRWHVLNTTINSQPENVDKIVLATVVLHNFLMLKKDKLYFNADLISDEIEVSQINGNVLRSVNFRSPNPSSATAFPLRDILKDYIYRSIDTNM